MFRLRDYHPEDHVRDYYTSKNDTELKKTDWNFLEFPKMVRDRCRRGLLLVEHRLHKKRQVYSKKREDMNRKWKEVQKEGESLRQNFLQFNEFLQVNKAKRTRAKENTLETKRFKAKTEKSIVNLIDKIRYLKQTKIDIDGEITKHKQYQEYLGKVVEKFGFQERLKNENDVLERFENYVKLSQQLALQSQTVFGNLQYAKKNMNKFLDTSDETLLRLHTHTATLQSHYEEVLRRVRSWEFWLSEIMGNIFEKMDEINLVKSSVWNLYCLMVRRRNASLRIKKENFGRQLVYIKYTLQHFHDLLNKISPTKQTSRKKIISLK